MLIWHEDRITKSHDLTDLLESLLLSVPGLDSYRHAAELLTPYATEFRYPGDFIEPDPEEFREAYDTAQEFLAFIIMHLDQELST